MDWENKNSTLNETKKVNFDYVSTQNNSELYKAVFEEVNSENIRLILFNIFSWVIFLFAGIVNLLWFLKLGEVIKLDVAKEMHFFVPWFSIPVFIISLIMVVYAGLARYTFEQERNFYFTNINTLDLNRVPNFIIDKFKNISGFQIFYNWFAGVSYVVSALILTFFFVFQSKEVISLPGGLEISLSSGKIFPDYKWDIIWTFVYVGVVFFCHVAMVIYCVREKSRLTAIFDLRKKIDYQEIKDYEKKIHIVCFVFFMLPLVIFFIIYWLVRKKKE